MHRTTREFCKREVRGKSGGIQVKIPPHFLRSCEKGDPQAKLQKYYRVGVEYWESFMGSKSERVIKSQGNP